jgi:glycosyltransferase involved in cell wall biosynthesis
MKIGYIGIKGLPSKAGADRVVEAIVERLADEHKLSVYCSSLVIPPGATYPGVELIRIPVLPGKHLHATSLFLFSAIHALTRDFDLIHVHNLEAFFVVLILKLRFKVIATSHGSYLREKWGTLAKSLIHLSTWPVKFANCITTVSKPQVSYDEAQYGKSVLYIPNGIDPEEFDTDLTSTQDLLQEYNIEPNGYLLFAAGRIIPTKGASVLLNAYRSMNTKHGLLIVGDTSQVPEHHKELRYLADDRVIFIPFVDKNILLGLVRRASFFVFPSTIEAMSMMLLEAASQETPIISSDLPENCEVLPEHALFFKSGDEGDLREKMNWALHHPKQMQELGVKAREWVTDNYGWDSIVSEYNKIYKTVVG